MKILLLLCCLPLLVHAQQFDTKEISRWQKQASQVTIYRDHYGVPHVYGRTDADAVFGLMYAQCEDDFQRVEMNYIEKLGRQAELQGEKMLYEDLLNRLVIDQQAAKADYARAPLYLKKLCIAFADGINFYLQQNPQVKPAMLTRFEPWFPLMWTDGSIGAINTAGISIADIQHFYGKKESQASLANPFQEKELTGSNGFAFAPAITKNGHAILYINPHVTFYFRPEVHMVSEEGLNAYGAVTWGQFFIYQGFNEHCGWMHTSSGVDAADSYAEQVQHNGKSITYLYNGTQKKLGEKELRLQYKVDDKLQTKTIHSFYTHHGPVLAAAQDKWLSLRADNRLLNGLIQCWQRTKAKGLDDFNKSLDLEGNISNNTVYADAQGNIAYWHGNRIPKRDTSFDFSKPVDGSITATEWKGYHPIHETVHILNPANGWLQNCNSTPFTVAGINSPHKENYPKYMAPDGENFRGINAVRVLAEGNAYTLDKVIAAGYDRRLAVFEVLVPALVKAFTQAAPQDSLVLRDAVQLLSLWDFRSGENSEATTLAIEWAQLLMPQIINTPLPAGTEKDDVNLVRTFASTATPAQLMEPLNTAMQIIEKRYGNWKMAWGKVNRFQRISPAIENKFSDAEPSFPVGFTSSAWGQLPSYSSRLYPDTKLRYGYNGNSFVCAVEFGPKVKAKSLLAGGNSGDPASPHFFDQAKMYATGQFKDVLFYKEDVEKNVERKYKPGDKK